MKYFAEKEKTEQNAEEEAGPSHNQQAGDESAQQLVAVLGGEVTVEAAEKLLRQCNGNLQRAVNAHYDKPALPKAASKPQASPAVSCCPCPQNVVARFCNTDKNKLQKGCSSRDDCKSKQVPELTFKLLLPLQKLQL